MTFIEIQSEPVALLGFNFLIFLLISSVVASGNVKEVLFMPSSLILIILGWSLYVFITSKTADLSKLGFFELPHTIWCKSKSFPYHIYIVIIKYSFVPNCRE